MAAKTILTVLFLISLGVVVILGLRALPQRGDVDTGARDEILVTTAALPPGALLRAKDVVWHLSGTAEPGQIVRPAGAAGKANTELDQQARAEVYGAALRAGVSAGDPIRRSAIVKPGDRDSGSHRWGQHRSIVSWRPCRRHPHPDLQARPATDASFRQRDSRREPARSGGRHTRR